MRRTSFTISKKTPANSATGSTTPPAPKPSPGSGNGCCAGPSKPPTRCPSPPIRADASDTVAGLARRDAVPLPEAGDEVAAAPESGRKRHLFDALGAVAEEFDGGLQPDPVQVFGKVAAAVADQERGQMAFADAGGGGGFRQFERGFTLLFQRGVADAESGQFRSDFPVEVEKAVQAYWDIIYYGTETAAFTLSLKLAGPLTATTDDTETIPWSVEWLSGNDTKTLGSANGAKTEEVLVDYPDNDLRTFSDEANLTLSALFDPDEIILEICVML